MFDLKNSDKQELLSQSGCYEINVHCTFEHMHVYLNERHVYLNGIKNQSKILFSNLDSETPRPKFFEEKDGASRFFIECRILGVKFDLLWDVSLKLTLSESP